MTEAERRRRVEDICDAALQYEARDRAAFVASACGADERLRQEVEALLSHAQHAEEFLATPIDAVAANVLASEYAPLEGRRIGVYHILSLLGEGGMGRVYRARDTKLDRDVAIKILPEAFAADADRVGRFQREAKTLAALNHPNIAQIFGLEQAGSVHALAMELVAGEDLSQRIARGSIPIDDALPIAKQIAEALEAAHAQGIIHRDLKPANIKVRPDGTVKVLDFGLAKAMESTPAMSAIDSPTLSVHPTQPGVILGTASYMSPEQARGQAVDKRTDIWAFGCVLYEMLTGHVAFPGHTISDSLAGILEREPNWALLPATTPPPIRRLLARCLEKDLKRRVRDIGDAAIELSDASASPAKVTEPRRRVSRRIWGIASALVAVGLALGWTIARLRQPPVVENRAVRLTVNPPVGTEFGVDTGAAISPDGRMLAFVTGSSGTTKLWVRPLNSLSARELPGTDGATFPFWSPDSRSLGFFAVGKLKRIEIAGGLPTEICNVGLGRGGTWNEEGVILLNSVNDGPLLRVPAAGGAPVPFTTVDKAQGENSHRWPQFLPGGRDFLYFVRTASPEDYGVYLGSLDRPDQKTLVLRSPTNAIYVPNRGALSGQLLWVRDGTLVAQAFDPQVGQTSGEPVNVADGVASGLASKLGAVSASNDGTLVYGGAGIRHFQLAWFDREGKQVGEVGQPEEYTGGLRISPDGKRVAATRSGDVWQMEFARGIPTRVTFGGGVDPVWRPDSQRIAYWKGAPNNLFSRSTNGTGDEERLTESHDSLRTQDWSPDGRFLLFLVNTNDLSLKTQIDLWVLPMTGNSKPTPFLSTPFQEGRGQFSPDGKWVAYTSDESGRNDVYVERFPASGDKLPVSNKGGDWVRWRQDGREMFYIAADRKLMSVDVLTTSGSLEFGTPRALFTIPFTQSSSGNLEPYAYDVRPDGQRFLAMVPVGDAATSPLMTVILNWQAELSTAKK